MLTAAGALHEDSDWYRGLPLRLVFPMPKVQPVRTLYHHWPFVTSAADLRCNATFSLDFGNSPTDINQSNFTINGLTIIHNGGIDLTDAIKVRRGATATITNAYVAVGTSSTFADFIDLEDSRGNSTSATNITAVGNSANGLNINDNKNAPSATISVSNGTTSSVSTTTTTNKITSQYQEKMV